MIVIYESSFQMLKQLIPCIGAYEHREVMQKLHITPRIKLFNKIVKLNNAHGIRVA